MNIVKIPTKTSDNFDVLAFWCILVIAVHCCVSFSIPLENKWGVSTDMEASRNCLTMCPSSTSWQVEICFHHSPCYLVRICGTTAAGGQSSEAVSIRRRRRRRGACFSIWSFGGVHKGAVWHQAKHVTHDGSGAVLVYKNLQNWDMNMGQMLGFFYSSTMDPMG